MAGYTENQVAGGEYYFNITTPNVAERIRQANNNARVITLQLDGDELDAALWGLENFQKGAKVTLRHDKDCTCGVNDCHWAPHMDRHTNNNNVRGA
jgi:hypothetical protein